MLKASILDEEAEDPGMQIQQGLLTILAKFRGSMPVVPSYYSGGLLNPQGFEVSLGNLMRNCLRLKKKKSMVKIAFYIKKSWVIRSLQFDKGDNKFCTCMSQGQELPGLGHILAHPLTIQNAVLGREKGVPWCLVLPGDAGSTFCFPLVY